MRRGYDRATYIEKAALLRDRRPDLVLTSDIIVGYPGETEDDFAATVSLVDAVGFEGLFVFTYSPRPARRALRLVDDVPEDEKLRRLKVLNDRQQRAQARLNAGWIGRVERVLVDAVDPRRAASLDGRRTSASCTPTDPRASSAARSTWRSTGSGANSLTGRILPRADRPPGRSYIRVGPRRHDGDRDDGQGPHDRSHHQHADHRPAGRRGQRVLPIWVGVFEANAIALQIEHVQTPRPMTHDLLKNMIDDLTRAWSGSWCAT
jgi:hypothetical protein